MNHSLANRTLNAQSNAKRASRESSKSNHGRAAAAAAGLPGRLRRRVVPPAPPRRGREEGEAAAAARSPGLAGAGQPAAGGLSSAPHHVRACERVRPAVPAPVRQRRGGGGRVGAGGGAVPAHPGCQLQQPPSKLRSRARGVQLPGSGVRALRLPVARAAEAVRAPPLLRQGPGRPAASGRARWRSW